MADGITSSSPDFDRLRASWREYVQWNRRQTEELAIRSARNLAGGVQDHGFGRAEGLYQVTADLAPTKAEITADVNAHLQPGKWDIPVQFADGRTGRGTPGQAKGRAWSRKLKGKTKAAKERFMGKARATTAQVRAFVIALRLNATLYLASGWLGAIEDLGGMIPSGSGRRGSGSSSGVDHERGGADIRKSTGLFEVEFWNRTRGIGVMDAKAGIVSKAVANIVADQQIYIARKKQEEREWLSSHGLAA